MTFTLHAPQLVYIFLVIVGLVISGRRHDEKKEGFYNFWTDLITTTISACLLYWGGFFG